MTRTWIFDRAFLGDAAAPVENAWMTLDAGRIIATGTSRPPLGATRHDAMFAMPGLIDCHVHLALSGGSDSIADAARPDLDAAIRENALAQLRSGVTTVRDLGAPGDAAINFARARRSDGAPRGPRILAAGAIADPHGHGNFLASHAETFDDYLRELHRLRALGVRHLKLFATGGVITSGTVPGSVQMPGNQLTLVTRAAHALGFIVAAHAHGAAGISNAVDAGVDTIEHCSYLDDSLATRLTAASHTTLVSTFVATERFIASPDRRRASPDTLQKIIDHAPHERSALTTAVDNNVRIAVGTDAGTTFNPHGFGMQEQAMHLHSAGMDTVRVLQSLTRTNAQTIGVRAGVLAPGYPADLLLLDADPSVDLRALHDIHDVILGGRSLTEQPPHHHESR